MMQPIWCHSLGYLLEARLMWYFMFSSSPAAIEACLGHLLKRRAAGFLRSDKIAALFTKVGKVYDTASEICRKVQEQLQQQADLTRFVSLDPRVKCVFYCIAFGRAIPSPRM